jgi:hypothetical protein
MLQDAVADKLLGETPRAQACQSAAAGVTRKIVMMCCRKLSCLFDCCELEVFALVILTFRIDAPSSPITR